MALAALRTRLADAELEAATTAAELAAAEAFVVENRTARSPTGAAKAKAKARQDTAAQRAIARQTAELDQQRRRRRPFTVDLSSARKTAPVVNVVAARRRRWRVIDPVHNFKKEFSGSRGDVVWAVSSDEVAQRLGLPGNPARSKFRRTLFQIERTGRCTAVAHSC